MCETLLLEKCKNGILFPVLLKKAFFRALGTELCEQKRFVSGNITVKIIIIIISKLMLGYLDPLAAKEISSLHVAHHHKEEN